MFGIGMPELLIIMVIILFRQASQFRCEDLQDGLKEVLAAEYRMKSSSVDSRLIMDNLLFNLMRQKMVGAPA